MGYFIAKTLNSVIYEWAVGKVVSSRGQWWCRLNKNERIFIDVTTIFSLSLSISILCISTFLFCTCKPPSLLYYKREILIDGFIVTKDVLYNFSYKHWLGVSELREETLLFTYYNTIYTKKWQANVTSISVNGVLFIF